MANAFGNLSLIGSSLLQHNRNFESIAQNLANSGTPGRKAERVFFRDLLTPSSEGRAPTPLGIASSFRIDHATQGQLVASAQSHHLAIDGDGYFLVQAQRGVSFENRLTRNGDFAPALAPPAADASESDTGAAADTGDLYLETAAGERLMGWYADDEGNLPDTRGISTVAPFRFETRTRKHPLLSNHRRGPGGAPARHRPRGRLLFGRCGIYRLSRAAAKRELGHIWLWMSPIAGRSA